MKKFLKVLFTTIVLCFIIVTVIFTNLFATYLIQHDYKQINGLAISYVVFVLIPSISLIKNRKHDIQMFEI